MLRLSLACLLLAAPLHAEGLRVTADIAPVQSLAAMVLGSHGEAETLLPQGDSAHHLSLRPSQARAVRDADIVVWVGPSLSPALAETLETLAPDVPLLTLQDSDGTHLLPYRDAEDFVLIDGHDDHDHADEHAGEDRHEDEHERDHDRDDDHQHGENDHGHDHSGGSDPHLWLTPENATVWLGVLADRFATLDPQNAQSYHDNAARALDVIDAAEADARAMLTTLQGHPMAVYHDAFQYFEKHFGLTVIGAISDSEAAAAGPATLAALRQTVADAKPVCLLIEPGANAGLIAAIDANTLPVAELDPMGAHIEQGAGFYPALIRDLATRLADCAQS